MNSMCIIASIASVIPFGNSMTVTAHVKDDDGKPAAGAIVKIWTDKDHYQGLSKAPTYSYFEAVTDTNGIAVLKFPCYSQEFQCCAYGDSFYLEKGGRGGYVDVKCIGHADFSVTLTEHNKDISFTLRRKRNPTTLCYAKSSLAQKLPKGSGEFGFDLLMYDWVAPYGDGKVADFYVQREETTTNSQRTVNSGIVFRGDGNGAYIRKKIKTTSDFETDYEADTNGVYQTYFPLRRFPWSGNPKHTESAIVKEDEYIVMRTRVEKNAKGEIIKAHYSVMLGAVRIDELFSWLIYYFNPTPNNPNLEKDLKRNINLEYIKKKRRRRPVVWPGQPHTPRRSHP